ncbi:hypothetical protein OEA41_009128 [Lepraria neglecta]|uniref:Uncharacterized protein n=1 Tax=Lepraria neglecta TaxID=209136 RepID=A0AAD9Z1D4_9LECA|nr:hypothetical protein OEA41_009128 [Lepraria neglecta]
MSTVISNNTITKGDGDSDMANKAEPEFHNLTLALDPMLKALKNMTCKIELTTSSIIYDKLFQRHGDNSSFYGYYQQLAASIASLLDNPDELYEDNERLLPLFDILGDAIETPVANREDACKGVGGSGVVRVEGEQVVFGGEEL